MDQLDYLGRKSDGLALAGRILLSAIFLISGVSKILNWGQTLQYMSGMGIGLTPVFLLAATVIEILGGLSILFGVKARWGAALLIVYLIPVTLTFHSFWRFSGMDHQVQMVNFLKNLCIMGGLFQVMAWGAGLFSLDASSYHHGARGRRVLDQRDTEVKIRRIS